MAVSLADRAPRDGGAPDDAYRRLAAAYEQSLRYAQDVRRLYGQLQRSICQSLLGLANALEAKDPYTRGHSERVAGLGRRLAETLRLPPGATAAIGQAGLLHDIGKIGVPEQVLRKAGTLDADEWAMMRRHPVVGAQIVAPFEFLAEGAVLIRHHHERIDGSGYPDGLCRDAIPLGARIIAVADVFDALTTDRPYRKALSGDEADRYLAEQAGRTLDDAVVAAFLALRRSGSPAS
jgi:HD-GYP domain-containing protein (c-di-GMP phosphodiesterase class II)